MLVALVVFPLDNNPVFNILTDILVDRRMFNPVKRYKSMLKDLLRTNYRELLFFQGRNMLRFSMKCIQSALIFEVTNQVLNLGIYN